MLRAYFFRFVFYDLVENCLKSDAWWHFQITLQQQNLDKGEEAANEIVVQVMLWLGVEWLSRAFNDVINLGEAD